MNKSFLEALLPSLRNESFTLCCVLFEPLSPERPAVLKLSRLAGMFASTKTCLVMPGTGWVSPHTPWAVLSAGRGGGTWEEKSLALQGTNFP